MSHPCDQCIVRPICQIEREGECPNLDRWMNLSLLERWVELHPEILDYMKGSGV